MEIGSLEDTIGNAIVAAADEIIEGNFMMNLLLIQFKVEQVRRLI